MNWWGHKHQSVFHKVHPQVVCETYWFFYDRSASLAFAWTLELQASPDFEMAWGIELRKRDSLWVLESEVLWREEKAPTTHFDVPVSNVDDLKDGITQTLAFFDSRTEMDVARYREALSGA